MGKNNKMNSAFPSILHKKTKHQLEAEAAHITDYILDRSRVVSTNVGALNIY